MLPTAVTETLFLSFCPFTVDRGIIFGLEAYGTGPLFLVLQFVACLVTRASGYWSLSHPAVHLHLFTDEKGGEL